MEVKVESTIENKLLDRREIEATVSFEAATPARKEMKTALCGKIGANPELVVLRSVSTEFGLKKATLSAHSYVSKEALLKNEPRHILKREGMITETPEEKAEAEKKGTKKKSKK
jgi:small subunit ribosomal protein S24e